MKRILAVDDEADLTRLYHFALEDAGFKVDTYDDPLLALSHFRPDLYDLVILDVMMPSMDGFELYEQLRKKDDKVKICFLTASELYYEEFRKREYDALDKNLFIQKPIGNEELIDRINKIIAK